MCTKLSDYRLKLYGNTHYLASVPPINTLDDLGAHTFIGYVEELLFSDHLRYLEDLVDTEKVIFKSTSVIAQYQAAAHSESLAILPCFMAEQDPRLQAVLEDQIAITRSFWMYCHEDLRHSRRVMALWDFLKQSVQLNQALLQGESAQLQYISSQTG